MYEARTQKKFITLKLNRATKEMNLRKILVILGQKCIQPVLFVRLVLKRIELKKDLFLFDIEQGQEVFISNDLSQSSYPLSFRYYDPLMRIVQDRMTYERKEYYKLKNDLELKIYRRNDKTAQMLEKLGIRESLEDDAAKLAFKHHAINKRETNNIQIADSIHSKSVQRSNFLKIDNELMQEIHRNPEKVKLMNRNLK